VDLQYVDGLGEMAGERLAFPQVNQDEQGLLPGFSFRQHEPIDARWRRMIPDTYVRVRDDNGSAAR